jgi:hypothetical protein
MEINITKQQYKLIREALEQYYYICKDEYNDSKLEPIIKLEESLIEQSKKKS